MTHKCTRLSKAAKKLSRKAAPLRVRGGADEDVLMSDGKSTSPTADEISDQGRVVEQDADVEDAMDEGEPDLANLNIADDGGEDGGEDFDFGNPDNYQLLDEDAAAVNEDAAAVNANPGDGAAPIQPIRPPRTACSQTAGVAATRPGVWAKFGRDRRARATEEEQPSGRHYIDGVRVTGDAAEQSNATLNSMDRLFSYMQKEVSWRICNAIRYWDPAAYQFTQV